MRLRFGLNPLQQRVFGAAEIILSTDLPAFSIQAGHSPVLEHRPCALVSGEYRIPAPLDFKLDVECERYLFALQIKAIEGPIARRYSQVADEYKRWLEENPLGSDSFYNEPFSFEFTEDTLHLITRQPPRSDRRLRRLISYPALVSGAVFSSTLELYTFFSS